MEENPKSTPTPRTRWYSRFLAVVVKIRFPSSFDRTVKTKLSNCGNTWFPTVSAVQKQPRMLNKQLRKLKKNFLLFQWCPAPVLALVCFGEPKKSPITCPLDLVSGLVFYYLNNFYTNYHSCKKDKKER